VKRYCFRSLRGAPATFYALLLLEIIKSSLFRATDGQNVDITVGTRQWAEILVIVLIFGVHVSGLRRIFGAFRVLARFTRFALVLYASCITVSIVVSINPVLSLLRTIDCFNYLAVALVWGVDLSRTRHDDFMQAVWSAMITVCRFYILLQCCAALAHAHEASIVETLKSNSYSIPCALLFALTLATRGIRLGKGLGTAIVGLILFQSLTSVLAALAGLIWLMLERLILSRNAIFLRARLLLLAGLMMVAALVYPVAIGAVEGVGQLMGRDAKSITNLTGRSELWGNLIRQITAEPSRFALGLGYGVGERIYVQKFNEDYKRDMASIGIYDVAIATHSHNAILAAIINIGFLGTVATFLLYFGQLLKPAIWRPEDAKGAFMFFLIAAVQAVSTNLFATNDLLSLLYVIAVCVPRRPAPVPRWRAIQAYGHPEPLARPTSASVALDGIGSTEPPRPSPRFR